MKKSFQRVFATQNLFQGKQSLSIFMLAAIFALTACDDSSSAGDDDNNIILSGDSREESSDSRSNDKDEAISSSGKVSPATRIHLERLRSQAAVLRAR